MRLALLLFAVASSGCAFLDPIDYAQRIRPPHVTELGGSDYGTYADNPRVLWRSDDHVHWSAVAAFDAPIGEIRLLPGARVLAVFTEDGQQFDSEDYGRHWQRAR